MKHSLSRGAACAAMAGLALVSATAFADDSDVARWQSVLGLVQAGNTVGSGAGQVAGGGQPWSTLGGHAQVDLRSGRADFAVRGLVFAGGNATGTPGSVVQVKGTLVCDSDGSAGGGNSVLVDTPLVSLDDEGNAAFRGSLGSLPGVCATEPDLAFLVRIPAGRWIAYGAVLR